MKWEAEYLEKADVILFWVPRKLSDGMLGLTTNVEFGLYLQSGKIIYGRPEGADKTRYLDTKYRDICKLTPIDDLHTLVKAAINLL